MDNDCGSDIAQVSEDERFSEELKARPFIHRSRGGGHPSGELPDAHTLRIIGCISSGIQCG